MDLKEKLSDLLIDEYQIDVVKDEWRYYEIVNAIDIMIEMTQEIMKEEKNERKITCLVLNKCYLVNKVEESTDFRNLLSHFIEVKINRVVARDGLNATKISVSALH